MQKKHSSTGGISKAPPANLALYKMPGLDDLPENITAWPPQWQAEYKRWSVFYEAGENAPGEGAKSAEFFLRLAYGDALAVEVLP